MKTLKRSITVLVCLILFTSCTKSIDGKKEKEYIEKRKGIIYYKDEPFTGEMFENYENGQLRIKVNYIDGKLEDGLIKKYHRNGQLREMTNIKDGKLDGIYARYYFNGQLREKFKGKGNIKGGFQDGTMEKYDENGLLKDMYKYKDGKRKKID